MNHTSLAQYGWKDVQIEGGQAIPTSISTVEATELARLAKGQTVLEIGSAFGYSAIVMAKAGAHVLTVDTHEMTSSSLEDLEGNLQAYGVTHRVGVVVARSEDFMPILIRCNAQFGLIFIDGDHSAAAVRKDVRQALMLLKWRGLLACHDYGHGGMCVDVQTVLDDIFPEGPDNLVDSLWIHRV